MSPWLRALDARTELRSFLVATLPCLLLAVPAAFVWTAVGPRVVFAVGKDGLSADWGHAISGDAAFLVITAAAGAACGLLAYVVARPVGPEVAAGLLVGGLGAGLVTRAVGTQLRADRYPAAVRHFFPGTQGGVPVRLTDFAGVYAAVEVVGWALAALVVYLLLVSVFTPPDPVPEPEAISRSWPAPPFYPPERP